MPLQKLQFKPGVNRDQTNYSNEGGWNSCDKIRFRSGYPQKIGGWVRSGSYTLIGVCRQMYNYITTASDNILALGTSKKVYLETGTTNLIDITPLRVTYTGASVGHVTDNCFDTTNGSRIVNVNIEGHGATAGSYVTFSGVVGPIGGIPQAEFNAEFVVTSLVNSDNFTITVTTEATSTVVGGGGTAITAAFQINIGNDVATFGYGWGAGAWGRLTWGSGSTVPVVIPQRDWFFDQFDNDLIMNIRNGPVYYWEYVPAITGRGVLLSSLAGAADVPTEVMQTLVAQNNKHLLAFGCTPFGGGDFDPLLIRWATQDNPRVWTPLVTNSAGFIRVSRGSKIVSANATRQEILVFTDGTLNSLQFLGTTDVFGLQELSDNISIISPRCVATVNNTAYWMGKDKFYAYSGRVETLPTTLRNHVFQNLNYDQVDQIVCGTNEAWNEIWWFYPSANSNVNDSYVIYNYLERIWYYGTIERTAWLDSPSREYPVAVGSHILYEHENGVNADTLPLAAEITSSDFDIIDGDQFMLMKRIIPDIDFAGSTAAAPEAFMTIKPRNFPGSAYTNIDTGNVIQTSVDVYTEQVFLRARARQMGFKISSTDLGVQWQLGSPRLDGRPDGKR
jgi:hypothetical protein